MCACGFGAVLCFKKLYIKIFVYETLQWHQTGLLTHILGSTVPRFLNKTFLIGMLDVSEGPYAMSLLCKAKGDVNKHD